MDDLTKQQQYIITNFYKIFKDRQKRGLSRSECKNFKSSDEVHKEFFDYLNKEDFIADTRTLRGKDYITGAFASNMVVEIAISDKTIIYMENRFKNNIKDIVKFLSDIRGFF
ncbi:hypothetical protein MTW97_01670 [Mammaliicoccus sciuri]|uniref:hypothetical protein n=1 Tax=Mammaliicoccus sciuri TaxID=1296 RepID=UPI001FB441CC|nr:hypothetical protein [Mammaliicoccus sciuri]MCJ0921352.1 hypothetical protein [Mammaliicoccus sciuri]